MAFSHVLMYRKIGILNIFTCTCHTHTFPKLWGGEGLKPLGRSALVDKNRLLDEEFEQYVAQMTARI